MPEPVKEAELGPLERALTPERMRRATGTDSDPLQVRLLDQALSAAWPKKGGNQDDAIVAILSSLEAIAPADGVEGMRAAQMVATHEAAMDCLRRAMHPEQAFEARNANLKHAAKLLRIYARQMEALDKHRNRGQQKITVEHVTVHAGGQAIVGDVQAPALTNSAPTVAPAMHIEQGTAAPGPTDLTALSTRRAKQPVMAREQ